MAAIVDRFVWLSDQYDFKPILLVFPFQRDELYLPADDPRRFRFAPPYRRFLDDTRHRHAGDLDVIDMADRLLDATRPVNLAAYRVTETRGHMSAYGNRIIAEHVFEKLVETPGSFQATQPGESAR